MDTRRNRFNGAEVGCVECGTVFRVSTDSEVGEISDEVRAEEVESTYIPRFQADVTCPVCGHATVVTTGYSRIANGERIRPTEEIVREEVEEAPVQVEPYFELPPVSEAIDPVPVEELDNAN